MKSLLAVAAVFLSAVALQAAETPKIVVAKSHADWCGSCQTIEPHFKNIQNKFDSKPVLFVTLDYTNQTTKHQASLLAGQLGLDSAIEKNKGTGFILVTDNKGKVLKKFTKEMNTKDMSNELNKLLK